MRPRQGRWNDENFKVDNVKMLIIYLRLNHNFRDLYTG